MSMNPMQKKARLYFLLGVLITLVIAGIIIFILLLKMKSLKTAQTTAYSNVYVVTSDIKSGENIQGKIVSKKIENKITKEKIMKIELKC